LTNDEDNVKYQLIIYFQSQRIKQNDFFVSSRFVLVRNRQPYYFWLAYFIWPENYSWSAEIVDFLKRFARIKVLCRELLDRINWSHTITTFNNLDEPFPQEVDEEYEQLAKEIKDKNIRFIKQDVVELNDYKEMYPQAIKMQLEVDDLIVGEHSQVEQSRISTQDGVIFNNLIN